jgi:GTPase involved in cell partitioning and DNA repair
MARTTVDDVKNILDDTSLTDGIITAYIDDANVFVTAHLTGEGLSDSVLEKIEKWITAHMITVTRERMAAKEGAGGAEITYTGKWGEGMKSTPYGQMAIELDTSDTLLDMTEGKKESSSRAVESFED